jgi:hypothetical protein
MRNVLLILPLLVSLVARADDGGPPDGGAPPPDAAAAPAATAAPAAPAKSGDEFNFELTPAPTKPSLLDESAQRKLESRVRLRRKLLTAHQALGFITLGLLAVTNILGTLLYVDKYGGGTDSYNLHWYHVGFAIGATGTFTGAALTALFAPNPYPKPIKFDAAFVHKGSMALAAVCFVAQLILGPLSKYYEGQLFQRDIALAHLVTGWGAMGFMTAGTLAWVFK